jgi:hypothetical protein
MNIPPTQGKVAHIDDEDWPLVSQYTWHAKREKGGKWYAATTIWNPTAKRHESIRMHRLIMGAGPDRKGFNKGTFCNSMDIERQQGLPFGPSG